MHTNTKTHNRDLSQIRVMFSKIIHKSAPCIVVSFLHSYIVLTLLQTHAEIHADLDKTGPATLSFYFSRFSIIVMNSLLHCSALSFDSIALLHSLE
jgi:hypothetical protein